MDKVKRFVKNNTIWAVLILIFIVAAIISPNFLSASNLLSVVQTESVVGVIACGTMWCILSAGIDLSSGSMFRRHLTQEQCTKDLSFL